MCYACDPGERLGAPSICFVCVFVCRKLSLHLGVWELDHRCWLSLCCFFVWICILCLRVRVCNCCASCPLVCYAYLPSAWCLWKLCCQWVYWWVSWSERKRTLFLPWIVPSPLSCIWWKSVCFVVVCSHVVC